MIVHSIYIVFKVLSYTALTFQEFQVPAVQCTSFLLVKSSFIVELSIYVIHLFSTQRILLYVCNCNSLTMQQERNFAPECGSGYRKLPGERSYHPDRWFPHGKKEVVVSQIISLHIVRIYES